MKVLGNVRKLSLNSITKCTNILITANNTLELNVRAIPELITWGGVGRHFFPRPITHTIKI